MPDIKRNVKIVTTQTITDKQSVVEGFPWRAWTISIYLLDEHGGELPASIFSKVTYKLHESFAERAKQVFTAPPFKISEEGWGEFDMEIILTAAEKGGDTILRHDLNFQKEKYDAKHLVVFKNPKPALIALLRDSGPAPGDDSKKRVDDSAKKKKRLDKAVDLEKLAEYLEQLQEDDLLQAIQMIHDNKTSDMYVKNDMELGEVHVDLYTLSDSLLRMLWEFSETRI